MLRIDVDAHIDESEATWEYLDDGERRFKPITLDPGTATAAGDARPHRLWVIDGNIRLRRWRDDQRTGTVKATRELIDVEARIRHMDELRVDVQVLYPTLFLHALTDRPEIDVALCKSYNRWIAKATEKSRGRLRWVAILPLLNIDKAVEEVRWAKDHGACGVFKKGIECGDRAASDPYFFPVYDEAARLDLPVCIHNATGKVESDVVDEPTRLGAKRTTGRAHHASGHAILKTVRVADRDGELADTNFFGIAQRRRHQSASGNADYRDVTGRIVPDHRGFKAAPIVQGHRQTAGVVDHVAVGQNETVGRENKT